MIVNLKIDIEYFTGNYVLHDLNMNIVYQQYEGYLYDKMDENRMSTF